ncbi:hypothetical protein MHU86_25129 [Fragilaria crotonensis]|nr:hypothetical protein MHU86_25129 [Fragilaria crotonensis]
MQFIPSSVPDGTVEFSVGSTSGASFDVAVKPVCMTFEDYFAAFSPDSHPSLSVSPAIGRMDRRGGEPTIMSVRCEPLGASGKLEGNLVINLPEDNSKICYKVIVSSF